MKWRDRGHRRNQEGLGDPGPDHRARLLAGYDTGTDPVADVTIPGVGADARVEPFRGWKQVGLTLRGGVWQFHGYGSSTYGVEAVAACHASSYGRVRGGHRSPDPKCSCGLYAHALTGPLPDVGESVALLEVELYGRVMEGQIGFRGEKMRVLSATAQLCTINVPRCRVAMPEHMEPHTTYYEVPTCGAHAGYRVRKTGDLVCGRHALDAGGRFDEYVSDLDALASDLRRDLPTDWKFV